MWSSLNQSCFFLLRNDVVFFLAKQRRLKDVAVPTDSKASESNSDENVPEFCIDAGSIGNFARFINHSCEPNLFVQCVLSSHHDIKLARVVLFAADNIPPLQVLRNTSAWGGGGLTRTCSLYIETWSILLSLYCRSWHTTMDIRLIAFMGQMGRWKCLLATVEQEIVENASTSKE